MNPGAKTIIIGGGVSGLGLGWKLGQLGCPSVILEGEDIVGGLARTVRKGDCGIDVGPHSFFSEDQDIVDTVLELFGRELKPSPRSVKFYYQGKYLDYPLTPTSVLFQMGYLNGLRSVLSFLKSRIVPHTANPKDGEDETVTDWALSSFGEHLYRTFFKPYTEQFWKIPCTELSARSIPTHTRMSFVNTLKLLLVKHLKRMGSSLIEREMLPTYYPPTGFGEICEKIASAARSAGAQIEMGARVQEIHREGEVFRVRFEQNGAIREVTGDRIVSTIILPHFVSMLRPSAPPEVVTAAERLDYRALVALGMVTPKRELLEAGYIYVLNRPYNRVTDMNVFSEHTSPPGKNILVVEMPVLRDSLAWKATKEQLFDMCIDSLAEDGIIQPGDVEDLIVVKAPYAYPVYRKDYAPNLKKVLDFIGSQPGLHTLGRLGEFMYMDIDKCLRRAFDRAEELMRKN